MNLVSSDFCLDGLCRPLTRMFHQLVWRDRVTGNPPRRGGPERSRASAKKMGVPSLGTLDRSHAKAWFMKYPG
jgi:hypothetical protein